MVIFNFGIWLRHMKTENMLVIFSSKNFKRGHKLNLQCSIYISFLHHTCEAPFENMKMQCQKWPEMPLILRKSGTWIAAIVTKLLTLYCLAHLVESYCKHSNISDTNWLHLIWSKFSWVYDLITHLICIII